MPASLAFPFFPSYTLNTKVDETANGYSVHGVNWTAKAKVRLNDQSNHRFKIGFIQVVKAYEIRADYQRSILDYKLPSTPMCDTDPATDAPWYEASAVKIPAGFSPEVTAPCNQIFEPEMGDHPSAPFLWADNFDGNANPAQRFRRKQTFQTWLVVNDQNAQTFETLYCFSYSIDQVVSIDPSKALGQRCKVEVGASSAAASPTTYSTAPFPKIPQQAWIQQCPNTSQQLFRTVRTK
jgi:hypothetical protein